jgi:hypothetical protein
MVTEVTTGYTQVGKLKVKRRCKDPRALGKLIATDAQEEFFAVVRGRWFDPCLVDEICLVPVGVHAGGLPVSLPHALEALVAGDAMQGRVTCVHVYPKRYQPPVNWERSLALDRELAREINAMAARGDNYLDLHLPIRYVVVRGDAPMTILAGPGRRTTRGACRVTPP